MPVLTKYLFEMKIITLYQMLVVAFVLAIVIIATVFGTGQTFGKRCSEYYETGSKEWHECVERLSNGERLTPN